MTHVGAPGPPDNADVAATVTITDVRCIGATTACGAANDVDGPDYTGELQANATIRITDRFNATSGVNGTDGATMVDIPFPIQMGCANTDTSVGATCSTTTSFNAIIPATIRERKRMNIEVAQFAVVDGGPDGDTQTVPNTIFMRQGVFVP
jgi:hypothetical protein